MLVGWINSLPREVTVANVRMLARLGNDMGIPLLVTSTMEDRVGTNIPDIQELAPTAYANRIARGGTLNCFLDPALSAAVQALGRTNLILAGLTTDICMYHSAVGALEAGYTIQVVADACGSSTAMSDEITFDRLRAQGATITVGNQILTELYSDFGTEAGQQAMNINLEEVVSRLAR
jgi:isochorismate hydrolase